ncbi:MAG: 4'-phosphopantetheinyl transferase superfamily protein [Phenylobacterium sp.]|uniref:4'-phosphopantetheinyl transferase family protein n=1 Tax=Phenylobacterium sp. TaxID=1871053 RepID=UPI00356592D7
MAGLMASILPTGAVAEERLDDLVEAPLWPEEEALIARAAPGRRREFATTRACARRVLRRLGSTPGPLLPGCLGAPIWPVGVVGSLTHCPGYRAAAAAPADVTRSLGIDAEPNAPLPPGVLTEIATPREQAGLPGPAAVCWDRLLFCAKEAVYKAWSPLTRVFLGFEDLEVVLAPEVGAFAAEVTAASTPQAPRLFIGRWTMGEGLLAAVAIPAARGRP